MRSILERLMLSDLSEANDPFFLYHNDIQAILYFGDGGMFPQEIKLYNRECEDDGSLSAAQLRDGIEFLRESLRAGRRVLAVGPTGATIVSAYLAEMGFSTAQALELVTNGRGQAPTPDTDCLEEHAEELQRRSTTTVHGWM